MSRSNTTPPPPGYPAPQDPRDAAPQWQGGQDPYAQFHAEAAAWAARQPQAAPAQPSYPPAPPAYVPAQHQAADPRFYGDQTNYDPRLFAPPPPPMPQGREPRPLDLADFSMPAPGHHGADPLAGFGHAPDSSGRAPFDPRFQHAGYDQRGYAEPALPSGYGHPVPSAPGYAADFGAPQGAYGAPGGEQDPAHDEYDEVEEEPPRRSGRVMIAAALVGAIGLGGGLAYAYKTFTGPSGKAPVIKADATPSKSKPVPHSGGKVNERLGDPVPTDADVARTRQVPTQTITAAPPPSSAPPGSVAAMPGLVLDNSAMAPRPLPPVVPAAPPASAGPAPIAPPAVATVPVRPTTPPPSPGSGPAPVNPRVAALPPPAAPPAVAERAPAPAPKPPAKTPVPKTSDAFTPSTGGGVAAAGPTGSTTTTPPASGLGASGNGFVAVIASQKSRMDAMKVFADLQQKYPDVLGSKAAEVQEVNLGEAKGGVWFRAVVGPPGSRQAAAKVCTDLRAAGLPEKQCWATAY